jgi:hypothetical protein
MALQEQRERCSLRLSCVPKLENFFPKNLTLFFISRKRVPEDYLLFLTQMKVRENVKQLVHLPPQMRWTIVNTKFQLWIVWHVVGPFNTTWTNQTVQLSLV